jgi:hypothetical protein
MEFLLLWWDELDDLTHACRHVATCAVAEVAVVAVPFAQGFAVVLASLLVLP